MKEQFIENGSIFVFKLRVLKHKSSYLEKLVFIL